MEQTKFNGSNLQYLMK